MFKTKLEEIILCKSIANITVIRAKQKNIDQLLEGFHNGTTASIDFH